MSDYYQTFVVLSDEQTYSDGESAFVIRTVLPVNVDVVEENHGSDGVAQELRAFGDVVTIERLLAVYDAAKALADAEWEEDGSISDDVLEAVNGVSGAVYPA